jgi:hypothetical protein
MPSSLYGDFDESAGSFTLTAEPPRKWSSLHHTAINHDEPEIYAEEAHNNGLCETAEIARRTGDSARQRKAAAYFLRERWLGHTPKTGAAATTTQNLVTS